MGARDEALRVRPIIAELESQVAQGLAREREFMSRVEDSRGEVAEALGMEYGEVPPSWRRIAQAAAALRAQAEASVPPCDDCEGSALTVLQAFTRLSEGLPVQVKIGLAWHRIFTFKRSQEA